MSRLVKGTTTTRIPHDKLLRLTPKKRFLHRASTLYIPHKELKASEQARIVIAMKGKSPLLHVALAIMVTEWTSLRIMDSFGTS